MSSIRVHRSTAMRSSQTWGPHFGHATGCAWNRRSRGSVFTSTVRAHGEACHRGLRPIIGDVLDDCEARSAVGAVDEGIMVAAVMGVEEFAQAIRADGDIRRNGLEGLGSGLRVQDFKACEADLQGRRKQGNRQCEKAGAPRRGGRLRRHPGPLAAHLPGISTPAEVFRTHPRIPSREAELANKGAEADPLNNARDVDIGPTHHFIRRPRLPRRIPHRSRSWPPYCRSSDK